MTDKEALICFSCFGRFGPKRIAELIKYFGSASKAWAASSEQYRKFGTDKMLVESFLKFREEFRPKQYLENLKDLNIEVVTKQEKYYPKRLREINDPPFLLYIRKPADISLSKVKEWFENSLAVVGTRKPTRYGLEAVERIVSRLAEAGLTIVSGLALGIDAAAHRTALKSGGKTIAVLASGLDNITPRTNQSIAEEVLRKGCGILLSEAPLGARADRSAFPIRNRIISGLVPAVLVIEGAEHSGTLITASYAAKQGRDVFAVPGSIFSSLSWAPHFLIKNGAKLVDSADDILEELDIALEGETGNVQLDSSEEQILNLLALQPHTIDSIAKNIGLPVWEIMVLLTNLELKGMVKNIDGVYSKI